MSRRQRLSVETVLRLTPAATVQNDVDCARAALAFVPEQ
jgi:hypothetical protein